jgi:hypothetical protein
MTSYNEDGVELTPSSAAPPSRLVNGPAESAAWAHQVGEAQQAIAQMRGPEMGAHQAAVVGGPTSVADEVPAMRPASPGQTASPDLLTQLHQMQGQGQ